ncbi:MAG: HIT family protein [Candidatus Aenigmarchaeota archaeon]|nr:HIT family protein [Candidatus Aenigmarchaeota archaeon]
MNSQTAHVSEHDCLFCKIARNEVPSFKVYEDEKVVAILDINPASSGHTLIMPKKHYLNLHDIPENTLSDCMTVVKKMTDRTRNKLNAVGVNIMQNNGRQAGQVIDHIHFHVIPRYENDGIMMRFPRVQLSNEEMKKIQDKLKEEEKDDKVNWI